MSPTAPQGDDALTDRDILTTRILAAPREAVFAAWSDPVLLAQWWGPAGFTNTFETFDLRPGGRWRFTMHGPDGTAFPNESVFTEITAPERIVFDNVSVPHFQVAATFTEVAGGTRLAFRMRFATVAECNAIKHLAEGANEQVFDRLAALLGEG